MVKIISHRGNLNGPKTAPRGENSEFAINFALDQGFDVEIDVQNFNGYNKIITGHDESEYLIDIHQFDADKLWFHAKTVQAFNAFADKEFKYNAFYHTNEDVVLTLKGNLWFFPKKLASFSSKSVMVLPEAFWRRTRSITFPDNTKKEMAYWDFGDSMIKPLSYMGGICTDYPHELRDFLEKK